MKSLATFHFRKPHRPDITALPEMSRLATRLGDALTSGLSSVQPAPWRITPDGVIRDAAGPAGGDGSLLRFESAKGSLTAFLGLDRQTVSALLEVAMGGTGVEATFEMSDRPLSKIEQSLLQHACAKAASALAHAFSDVLGRPFDLFHDAQAPELDRSGEIVALRFVANVFSHSGEIRLTFAVDELERQMAAESSDEHGAELPEVARKLQQEVGKSEVTLTITLTEENLTVDTLTGIHQGKLIPLKATARAPVIVWSSGVAAYEAKLGRSGDRLAITITSALT